MKSFNDKCEKYSKKYGNFLAVDDENLKFFVSANLTLFDFDEKEAIKEFANLKKEYDNIFNLKAIILLNGVLNSLKFWTMMEISKALISSSAIRLI